MTERSPTAGQLSVDSDNCSSLPKQRSDRGEGKTINSERVYVSA